MAAENRFVLISFGIEGILKDNAITQNKNAAKKWLSFLTIIIY
jgi:hypothetical protein